MKNDNRKNRPYLLLSKKEQKILGLKILESFTIGERKIEFEPPNIVALLIDTSKKSAKKAREILEVQIGSSGDKKITFQNNDEKTSIIYDFIEQINISIIFGYNAIEAFINWAIPDDYLYESINNKGIKEAYNKSAIQRWLSTSEKLDKIIPEIRKLTKPSSEGFWDDFKKIEKLRNDIIHPKLGNYNDIREIHKEFFKVKIFKQLETFDKVLDFLCKGEYGEYYFPIGYGSKDTKPLEISSFADYLEEIPDDSHK